MLFIKEFVFIFQTFDFDLKGQTLGGSDELLVEIKDWERVGRNRFVLLYKCIKVESHIYESVILDIPIRFLDDFQIKILFHSESQTLHDETAGGLWFSC